MAGYASLPSLLAIVLENDGTWSVVPRTDDGDLSAFEGLELPSPEPARGTRTARARGRSSSQPV
jgi:hypothetical protein